MNLIIKAFKYYLSALLYDIGIFIIGFAPMSSAITASFGRKLEKKAFKLQRLEKELKEKIG